MTLSYGDQVGSYSSDCGTSNFYEMRFENGMLQNPCFRDYKVFTAPEMPELDLHFIESNCEEGPYGAKGASELPTIVVAPAIANAVYNATGIRFLNPPLTPEKVARAIWDKQELTG